MVPIGNFVGNYNGIGSAQYHPGCMADAGYDNEDPVKEVQGKKIDALVSVHSESRQDSRKHD